MKKMMIFLSLVLVSSTVLADQKATITCTGENVILLEKSPYLGEDSKFTQSLYVLKSVDATSESEYTAFFLNVAKQTVAGTTILTGKNEVGGKFKLEYKKMQDVGNGDVIDLEGPGVLTYSHGTLSGKNEPVKCVIE